MNTGLALIAVGSGGALGAVLRYLATAFFTQRYGPGFPFGTLFVNMTGCLLIGILAEVIQTRAMEAAPFVRLFLLVGVLGGYTTFSSFAYENVTLLSEGAAGLALVYAAGSVLGGTAATFAGIVLVRLLP
ncbi:MAG: fluoride efflux transporter CrcB [Candidatus Baltobacteraceae bacterium]